MQVFVPHQSPIEVATWLDARRKQKQVIECRQILAAIRGESNFWKNHPVVKMYRNHVTWLEYYMYCLECSIEASKLMRDGDVDEEAECCTLAMEWSQLADKCTPPFLTDEFCLQHKRRLYTKDPKRYEFYSGYGKSYENWYVVDGELLRYEYGKIIK